jgi:hypothetical protein
MLPEELRPLGIGFNLPVMRPILFGLAFKMLKFEPQMA